MLYPVSEIFVSPQGEGIYAGTMMTFVRLAGCTVGKPYPKDHPIRQGATLPIYTEKCTLYDGREFACDTDYRAKGKMDVQNIMSAITENVPRVCLTGGEPLMHKLEPLIENLTRRKRVHIETSGTIMAPDFITQDSRIWVAVSPKQGLLQEMTSIADELKFLVDKDFNPEAPFAFKDTNVIYTPLHLSLNTPSFLQPVNFENEVNVENLRLCKQWQEKFPTFRISPQYHKMMSHYLGEVIR